MVFGGKFQIKIYLSDPLPSVLLLPTCQQEREYCDIFLKPQRKRQKIGKFTKKCWITFYHSTAEIWPEEMKKQISKVFLAIWQGKILLSKEECCMTVFRSLGTSPAASAP